MSAPFFAADVPRRRLCAASGVEFRDPAVTPDLLAIYRTPTSAGNPFGQTEADRLAKLAELEAALAELGWTRPPHWSFAK
jgi:hypothetical protein